MPSAMKGEELRRMQRDGTLFPVAFGKAVGYSCQKCCLGLRENTPGYRKWKSKVSWAGLFPSLEPATGK